MLDLHAIEDLLVDGTVKGLPPGCPAIRLGDIGKQGWNLLRQDVPFPAAVIHEKTLRANSRWMRDFVQASGASICPHGKTSMAPQLFDLQLEDGAWGMTAATITQMVVYRRFGVQRIILANQLLGLKSLEFVTSELRNDPGFDFYCLVDSVANLRQIVDYLKSNPPARPLQLFIEIGMPGGRCGVRDEQTAIDLAESIKAASPLVALRGIEAFEGLVSVDSEAGRERVSSLLSIVTSVASQCDRRQLFAPGEIILSAGGSAHFDEVTRLFSDSGLSRETRIVLRSGCYLTHDEGFYGPAFDFIKQRSNAVASVMGNLAPALEIWGQVQSVPEAGLAIATLGKRDISYDIVLPSLSRICRVNSNSKVEPARGIGRVVALNDHHAYLSLEAGQQLTVGDLVSFSIAHPCTTFDKWQLIWLVDDDYKITGAVKTFF